MFLEIALGWLLLVVLVEIARFWKHHTFLGKVRTAAKPASEFSPFATVILPLKGLDYHLEQNIRALAEQDYPKYEILIVVDSKDDPAYAIAGRIKSKRITILKAKSRKDCSGKVAALLTGVQFARGDVFAFADSDMQPRKTWLRELVAPLNEEKVGVTTGYRWYFPLRGFASCLQSAWNTLGLGVMFGKHAFVWGGSFAIKKDVFEALKIEEQWHHAISDDTVAGEAVKHAGLGIRFVPTAVSASFAHSGFSDVMEWTNRQMTFIRMSSKKTWRAALFAYASISFIFLTGIALTLAGIFKPAYLPIGILILLLELLAVVRFRSLHETFRDVLPEYKEWFARKASSCALAEVLVPFVATYNLLKARSAKQIEWRGRVYSTDIESSV